MRKSFLIGILVIAFFVAIFLCLFRYKIVSADKAIVFTEQAPKPIGPYSQAVFKNDMLFVSGQIAINPLTNQLDTSSIENETKQVLENIKAILQAQGLKTSDVVKTTIYMTNLSNFQKVNEVYASYFKEGSPARETVQVAALPKNVNIEISVIAIK